MNLKMTPTAEEKLDLISEHFYYEVVELRISLELFSIDQIYRNAALNSFLLHSRNIMKFLFPSNKLKPRPDDAFATQFVEDWKVRLPDELAVIDQRANKEIMHLTYSRITGTPDNKKWDIGLIYFCLIRNLLDFIKLLPREYKVERIQDLEAALTDEVVLFNRQISASSSTVNTLHRTL